MGETGKESDQVIQCKRAGRHEGHNERRNVNNRTNRGKREKKTNEKGTGKSPTFDTSSSIHINTYTQETRS